MNTGRTTFSMILVMASFVLPITGLQGQVDEREAARLLREGNVAQRHVAIQSALRLGADAGQELRTALIVLSQGSAVAPFIYTIF